MQRKAVQQLALDAIGDGTRRAVLELLRDGPQTVGELAQQLPVSRPAVSKHLRILLDADLVTVTPSGTRRHHAINPQGLATVRLWLEQFWDTALDAFANHIETEQQ